MKLKRLLLRYYPPGILLEYDQAQIKTVDLLELNSKSDLLSIASQIQQQERLSESKCAILLELLRKLQSKIASESLSWRFIDTVTLRHLMPLANCAFNKAGDRIVTGSYDRTLKVWNTSGDLLLTLQGHLNVVFSLTFNFPFGYSFVLMMISSDKILSGSFDKTAKLWDSISGRCIQTFTGHTAEVVQVAFHPTDNSIIATASMDSTAILWDVPSASPIFILRVCLFSSS
jgi:dynein assembly factor with WDR repeat domains 1